MKHSVDYEKRQIAFDLIYSKRRTLGITVKPDSSVIVRASKYHPIHSIKEIVLNRAPWILKQKAKFAQAIPLSSPRRFVSGESFYYLGRQYRLKLKESNNEGVGLNGGYLNVSIRDKSDKRRIGKVVEDWYRYQANLYFTSELNAGLTKIKECDVANPTMKVRSMKSRWGSCSRKANITLNLQLIKAPSQCIEYVIMHELCHLKHHNHGRAFYSLLTKVMPDWRERRKQLATLYI